ncbi:hypothetical protein D3C81_1249970 [compost metagenome]
MCGDNFVPDASDLLHIPLNVQSTRTGNMISFGQIIISQRLTVDFQGEHQPCRRTANIRSCNRYFTWRVNGIFILGQDTQAGFAAWKLNKLYCFGMINFTVTEGEIDRFSGFLMTDIFDHFRSFLNRLAINSCNDISNGKLIRQFGLRYDTGYEDSFMLSRDSDSSFLKTGNDCILLGGAHHMPEQEAVFFIR